MPAMQKPSRPTAKILRFQLPDLMTWQEVRDCGLGPIPEDAAEAIDGYHEELAQVVDIRTAVRIARDR